MNIQEKNVNDQKMNDEYMSQILKEFNDEYKKAIKYPKSFRKVRKQCVAGLKDVLNNFYDKTGSEEFNVFIDVIKDGEIRMVEIGEVINTLQEKLKEDEDYFMSWKSNLAMAFHDAYFAANDRNALSNEEELEIHTIAGNAAENFLNNLIKE